MTWRKWLLILKCIATAVSMASGQEYVPTIAGAGGMAAVSSPAPLPGPAPSNICPDCNGKGWIGDGTHIEHCIRCDGTGKLTSRTLGGTDAPLLSPAPRPNLDAFYFAQHDYADALKMWPEAQPVLVFYWPSESDKAMTAYKHVWDRNQDGRYVVIPLCLADQWDADTYVAQHWKRHARSVVLLDGDEQITITDLKQLEN